MHSGGKLEITCHIVHTHSYHILPISHIALTTTAIPSAPTYEDYARRVHPQSMLDREVDAGMKTDIHLYEIASVLRDWESIAPWLGLDETRISDIRTSGRKAALIKSVFTKKCYSPLN